MSGKKNLEDQAFELIELAAAETEDLTRVFEFIEKLCREESIRVLTQQDRIPGHWIN